MSNVTAKATAGGGIGEKRHYLWLGSHDTEGALGWEYGSWLCHLQLHISFCKSWPFLGFHFLNYMRDGFTIKNWLASLWQTPIRTAIQGICSLPFKLMMICMVSSQEALDNVTDSTAVVWRQPFIPTMHCAPQLLQLGNISSPWLLRF
jgi:hypothetical protein